MKKIVLFLAIVVFSTMSFAQVGYVSGSDFGTFFKASCVYNQFDILIEHTSKASIDVHGKDAIVKLYKGLEISKQETWNFVATEGSGNSASQTYTRSLKGAYSREIVLNLIKEDGVWKIVLPNKLSEFLK
jgi:hypothetical protein